MDSAGGGGLFWFMSTHDRVLAAALDRRRDAVSSCLMKVGSWLGVGMPNSTSAMSESWGSYRSEERTRGIYTSDMMSSRTPRPRIRYTYTHTRKEERARHEIEVPQEERERDAARQRRTTAQTRVPQLVLASNAPYIHARRERDHTAGGPSSTRAAKRQIPSQSASALSEQPGKRAGEKSWKRPRVRLLWGYIDTEA
ncbi:hypothetical protein C8R45DRAFT_993954 [Mycena sanguinolenta]|nr:hypothetical protein C8R45DRAFT_993954 [Mycena sanguinolenta]